MSFNCIRCGVPVDVRNRWEDRLTTGMIEVTACCCATLTLWGSHEEDRRFDHPAIMTGSGYQKLRIEWGIGCPASYCWDCHRDFIAHLGNFLKQKLPPNSRQES